MSSFFCRKNVAPTLHSLLRLNGSFNGFLTTILLVISWLSNTCFAQQLSKVDSLTNVLMKQKEDTSKVNTLNLLSRELLQKALYKESRINADDALALAEKINFSAGKVNAYQNIATIHVYQSNYPEALKYHQVAFKISEESGYKKGMADSYNGIAGVYNNLGNYPEALKNLFAALKLEEEAHNEKGVANLLNNIGLIYSVQGNYSDAFKNLFSSLRIKQKLGDKRGMSNSMINLALIYINQANYTEATKYNLASLKLKEELGDKMGIAGCYNSIGSICDRQGNYPEALKNHFIALKIREEIGDKKGAGYSYNNIGYCFEKQGNYSEALKYHLLAIKIRKEIGEKVGLADSYYNLGEAYIGLNNFPQAKQLFTEGLSLSQKIGVKEVIKKCYEGLAKVDSASGNWQEAYHNHKLFILYRDSLVNEENNKKMVQTAMQYEFDKKADSLKYHQALTDEKLQKETLIAQQQEQSLVVKQKEVGLMRDQKKLQELEIEKTRADYAVQKAEGDNRQQQLVIVNNERALQTLQLKKQELFKKYLISGLALFLILSFFIYRNYRTRQKLRLQTLRNKIATDLHDDVGSTLSSISIFSQMAQQQSKEIIPLLETIENSSRQMLDAMADIVWTINPENDHFEKIILRMKSFAFELLGATKIDFEFIADENIAKMKIPMNVRKNLFLIFKEATNNMVKYSRADKAMFTVKGEKNNLMLVISDNGKGFNVRQDTEGNGLKNMKKRAQEIDGELLINSEPGKGTSVQLNVAV